ncbi:hypothetical protein M501DRAFT_1018560 [Patellaria atrata CBS 101060]|uniref:Zinc/iron permease n=1 Tax=Patellaria atrata CBS 101060 TaxID=1346257 RepID=A0A9P4S7X7_9PEZI|nr:hypothetical protein M501DRAFT_1018560 [Patellaria atrata CBS 101060]
MLPSAKRSLQNGGFSAKAASWTLIGCFLGGVIGIQILSRILHHYIPSHVVDCDHSHDEEDQTDPAVDKNDHLDRQPIEESQQLQKSSISDLRAPIQFNRTQTEPLPESESVTIDLDGRIGTVDRRSSFSLNLSKAVGAKPLCDSHGRCYGYSDPCGKDCFKLIQARGGIKLPHRSHNISRSSSTQHSVATLPRETQTLPDLNENTPLIHSPNLNGSRRRTRSRSSVTSSVCSHSPSHPNTHDAEDSDLESDAGTHQQSSHHHHVPTNAFLSIGLQTSLAIALHKLPEGFITYATNHANPQLGFSVFVALFIHNITEGFAMALPLYLALNSRWKAMFWSSLLGGVSQPLGAAVAAIWFKVAGSGEGEGPSEGVYGGMFAVVAGIMASVALQLFSESLDLTHSRDLCMAFAFVGMGILGISAALTA